MIKKLKPKPYPNHKIDYSSLTFGLDWTGGTLIRLKLWQHRVRKMTSSLLDLL